MPEESKKSHQKGKNEPREQRRRRQGRQPAGPAEKKPDKQPDKPIEKQSKEPEKPAYEPPGPEFYKNLKRETDEILKITEEANTKYKKKEIQSNWAKYELPVGSYEEIDEQENMGADYEKLIQAPATVGGHFQFKHEKSWDTDTGPSLYDKYFDINTDLLSLAVSTIPFYERNNIEKSVFNDNDILSMDNRATKFKQKYFKDKKYTTPELEAQEKIQSSIRLNNNIGNPELKNNDECKDMSKIHDNASSETILSIKEDSNTCVDIRMVKTKENSENEMFTPISSPVNEVIKDTKQHEEIKFKPDVDNMIIPNHVAEDEDSKLLFGSDEITGNVNENTETDLEFPKVESPIENKVVDDVIITANKPIAVTKDTQKNPIIESPEDLEKWLDDFLDG